MYCSRCQLRWAAAEAQTAACLPIERRSNKRQAITPPPAAAGAFNARALVLQHRGWVSSPGVLDRMEIIAREAFKLGQKTGRQS